jgi:hypothetical protein
MQAKSFPANCGLSRTEPAVFSKLPGNGGFYFLADTILLEVILREPGTRCPELFPNRLLNLLTMRLEHSSDQRKSNLVFSYLYPVKQV